MFEAKRNKENEEKLAKEQELQKVHVKKEDIELIVGLPESTFECFSLDLISFSRSEKWKSPDRRPRKLFGYTGAMW